jgi:hypothetical protein
MYLWVGSSEAAEKKLFNVIPSEARELLFRHSKKKVDSSSKPRTRNDTFGIFPQPVQPQRSGD